MKIFIKRLCGLAGCMMVAVSLHVGAAEFTCEVRDRNCLYDAVAAANQTSEPDIIRFSEGHHYANKLYPLSCAPSIVGDITIVGAGRIATHLHAIGACAFFHVPVGSSLTLRDIQVAGGKLIGSRVGPDIVQRGAAVYNEGLLHVERTNFTSNDVVENNVFLSGGGAIYNAPGATANLDDAGFHDNRVGPQNYGGAAILNEGVMTVTRSRFNENGGEGGYGSTIANGVPGFSTGASLLISDSVIEDGDGTGIHNHATLVVERTTIRDGDAAEGGGIYNGGEMTLRESAVIRNRAIKGGGIYSAEGATSTIINTTISHNHARGKVEGNGIGGGVYNYGGTVNLANVTIASNTSQGLGSAIASTSDADGSAYTYIKNSMIVGHADTTIEQSCYDFGPNDTPKNLLLENNLITAESNCYPSSTDIVVDEASTFTDVIGPIADYGGLTPGYALLPGSPAIDNAEKTCTDFEGFPILIDQHGNARTGCDIGAVDSTVETPPVALQLLLTDNQTGIQPGSTGTMILVMLSRADSTNPFEPIWDVDRSTIRLGSAGATPFKYTRIDLNEDGIHDLVMRFRINETGLACGDTAIDLQGTIVGGAEFVARADIVTVGCDGE
ncbi:choice-of-anchor Q domain-containing protein [Cellvibrio sp. ARAG 10.3]|uniref:choice-of-anchor Q domain-containing protein n=1 Tax=Cellvibrio sp. ARAG 10.3 TaxID=3451358 RepID=UPI003F477272